MKTTTQITLKTTITDFKSVQKFSLKNIFFMKQLYFVMLFCLVSFLSFSQSYESQSSEVQSRMDLNKINGVSQWDGIVTTYSVTFQGLSAQGIVSLQERVQNDSRILSIQIESTDKIVFNCNGGTPFEVVKGLLSNLITGIVSFEEKGSIKVNSNE